MLPTDDRYLRLTDEQVAIITNYWLLATPEDDLKRGYWAQRAEKEKPLPQENDLADLGYDQADIEAIMAELNRG